MFQYLDFRPAFGLSSPHLQTVLPAFSRPDKEPPSERLIIPLEDGDRLVCYISNPAKDKAPKKIIVMVHGLGGSYKSRYLIRLSRKVYEADLCAVRVNLRSCAADEDFASRPYNGGNSQDILHVLKLLKERYPLSPIVLIGFSLGGNIILKLAGELNQQAKTYIDQLIAICPTIDLYHAVQNIEKWQHWVYHQYYLSHLLQQSKKWVKKLSIKSIFEFDDKVTAPLWGYKNALDYYKKEPSAFISEIAIPTRILFAEDDPFIDCHLLNSMTIPSSVELYLTKKGGHMGFLGWSGKEHGYYRMDQLLMQWIKHPCEV